MPDLRIIQGGKQDGCKFVAVKDLPDNSLEGRIARSIAEHAAAAPEYFRATYGRTPSEEEAWDWAESIAAIQYAKELEAAFPPEPKGAA
jgi:hypothetical protein